MGDLLAEFIKTFRDKGPALAFALLVAAIAATNSRSSSWLGLSETWRRHIDANATYRDCAVILAVFAAAIVLYSASAWLLRYCVHCHRQKTLIQGYTCYFAIRNGGTVMICTGCFDDKKKLIRLLPKGGEGVCPVCNARYKDAAWELERLTEEQAKQR